MGGALPLFPLFSPSQTPVFCAMTIAKPRGRVLSAHLPPPADCPGAGDERYGAVGRVWQRRTEPLAQLRPLRFP
jgi:hypothetical protein